MDGPPGIDVAKTSAWLETHLPGARGPFDFELIAAGGSNLTFRLTDAAGAVHALRRPPAGRRVATAHDVAREWRILRALAAAPGVPVPEVPAVCEDEGVTGAPFYVMTFVEGTILRDRAQAAAFAPDEARRASESLVATQLALHTLDPGAVGLADLARSGEGYVPRQLRRWKKQVEAAKSRELPLLDEIHRRLSRNVPPELTAPALAHGDYRFDNTVLGPEQQVVAVLDWELCTLGDPVADFCWSLLYWADPEDEVVALVDPPTTAPGFPRRAEVAELYARTSGFDLSHLDTYMAFSWWKQACIVEGVAARFAKGTRGGMPTSDTASILERVDRYLALADDLTRP